MYTVLVWNHTVKFCIVFLKTSVLQKYKHELLQGLDTDPINFCFRT
jgi:hypothetical protein